MTHFTLFYLRVRFIKNTFLYLLVLLVGGLPRRENPLW